MDTAEILRKLRYQPNLKGAVLNAPEPIEEEFKKLGFVTTLTGKPRFAILFVKDKHDVETGVKMTIDHVEYDSIFWIAYPKGTSSIKTDINRDKLWDLLKPYGYRPVSMIAIDNDWSAMRVRPVEKVKSK